MQSQVVMSARPERELQPTSSREDRINVCCTQSSAQYVPSSGLGFPVTASPLTYDFFFIKKKKEKKVNSQGRTNSSSNVPHLHLTIHESLRFFLSWEIFGSLKFGCHLGKMFLAGLQEAPFPQTNGKCLEPRVSLKGK